MSLRILHFIPSLSIGGAERQLSYLAQAQLKLGHAVGIAYAHDGQLRQQLAVLGVSLHRLRGKSNWDWRLLRDGLAAARSFGPQLIQTWLPQMDVIGGIVAMVRGVPFVASERTSSAAYARTSLRQGLRKLVVSRAAFIVTNSEEGKGYWCAQGAGRVRVVPNAIDDRFFQVGERAPNAERTSGGTRLVTICRLDPVKNLATLLQAVDALLAAEFRLTLTIVGEGRERTILEQQCRQSGRLEQAVRFVGYAEDVAPFLGQADLFVSVSRREGEPNAVLEAMASGCPVLLSDIPGHRAIADADSAWFVPTDDVAAIGATIRGLLAQPEVAARRAMKARESVSSRGICSLGVAYDEVYRAIPCSNARTDVRPSASSGR